LTLRVVRNADATRLGDPFKPRSNVTPSPKISLSSIMMSPTCIPIAEFDPGVLRHVDILLCHAALHFSGTSSCVDGAREFDQHAVAGGLYDTPAMHGEGWINQRFLIALSWASVPSSSAPIKRL